jgi:chaperonin GroEL (HSP60 family)
MKEKKARVEDALHATRAAVEEGIVPAAASRCCAPGRARDAIVSEIKEEKKDKGGGHHGHGHM